MKLAYINNIGFLQHLLFGLVPVYVSVKIQYFYQVLEQKNRKQKSYMILTSRGLAGKTNF